jgi:hypothetical protein
MEETLQLSYCCTIVMIFRCLRYCNIIMSNSIVINYFIFYGFYFYELHNY